MRRITSIIVLLCLVVILSACRSGLIAGPTSQPHSTPSLASSTSSTEESGAPEATFMPVGSTAQWDEQDGTSGKAVVAGLQTLIIIGFTYDGKAQADLRLVNASDPDTAVHILTRLDRAYTQEVLQFAIPHDLGPGTADSIAIYDTRSERVLAIATFN